MQAVGQVLSSGALPSLRDSHWLIEEQERIWTDRFADVSRVNTIEISFAPSWKSRLGVISLSKDEQTSYIGINALLRLPEVPSVIAQITIAHELVHYAHGFGSPLTRHHRHPHRGRIVERELFARGFREDFLMYREWIDNNWFDFYDQVAVNPSVIVPQRVAGNPRESYQSR